MHFWKQRKKDAASLLKHFTYPRKGIGVICEKLAETIGGPNRLLFNAPVKEIFHDGKVINAVAYGDREGEERSNLTLLYRACPLRI